MHTVQKTIVGAQFLFVVFGATVLVPLLIGLEPSVALFTAGVGTLIFHAVTKGKVPIFLGSSFAFIAPIIKATELYGLPGALFGIIGVGLVYGIMSLLIRLRSVGFIALLTTVIVSLFGKGILRLIPIFSGIIIGYIASILFGEVDFQPVLNAKWFVLPAFVCPEVCWEAILFMIPVALAPVIEHIGDVYAINEVTGKDFVQDPGLHRTMLGDGLVRQETPGIKQNRVSSGQHSRFVIRGLLCHQITANSLLAMDMGWNHRRHQDCQSDIVLDHHQKILLPSYYSQ